MIGDDTAVVAPPAGPLLLAADAIVAGVHVDLARVGLDEVGWRAVTVNVSDVAAMGGRPLHLLVTLAAPPGCDLDLLLAGVAEAADAYGCEVAGGDLSSTPGPLVITVAVTGTVDDGGSPVLRSGARAGDGVYVSGPLGAAAASGYTRRPVARVAEGVAARRAGATAMIDVSDGLAADVGHIGDESGVGIALDRVPVAPGATLEQALGGGDDYELVFTAPSSPMGERIGVCSGDRDERTLAGEPLPRVGWEHRW